MCYQCGKYSHQIVACPRKTTAGATTRGENRSVEGGSVNKTSSSSSTSGGSPGEEDKAGRHNDSSKGNDKGNARFGPWMVARRGHRRTTRGSRGISRIDADQARSNVSGDDHAKQTDQLMRVLLANQMSLLQERSRGDLDSPCLIIRYLGIRWGRFKWE